MVGLNSSWEQVRDLVSQEESKLELLILVSLCKHCKRLIIVHQVLLEQSHDFFNSELAEKFKRSDPV